MTSAGEPAAVLDISAGIALITLNRPRVMNAADAAMSTAVGLALERVQDDPEVNVVVLTGAGRAFCAGADLKQVAAGKSVYAEHHPEWGFAGITRHHLDKPIIAAVNGAALGGGTEIVLACDLAVASESARFGLPEVRRGLIAAAGGLVRLPRQIPIKLALEAALTGETVDAATAHRWGLVNHVVPHGDVLNAALELAARIAANAPLAVRASKSVIRAQASFGEDREPGLWAMNDQVADRVLSSRDAHEGVRAFGANRSPVWKAR